MKDHGGPTVQSGTVVYGIHAVKRDEVTHTLLLCRRQSDAERYAQEVSRDSDVLAAPVTRYELDVLGIRSATALYVDGVRQAKPHLSDDRTVGVCAPGLRRA